MDKVGKYEIREQLGRGGMGAVYRAYDPIMERDVAIKIILEFALDVPEIKERFYREARTAGKLSHENITIVHDVGEDSGRPFIVMEYLSGEDLRGLLERHVPMTVGQKLDYALQICRGLAYAHANEVVHRDVKPANIRILGNGRVKIMDFGIARLGSSALTSTGAIMGTPYYMSPEQIQGKKVDRRADIFSCGVLLFELFTSQKPFRGEEPTSVMFKIVHEEPEGLDELQRVYPRELAAILAMMLTKDPAGRYQHLDDVVRDLEGVQTKLAGAWKNIGRRQKSTVQRESTPTDVHTAETQVGTTPHSPAPAGPLRKAMHYRRILGGIGAGVAVLILATFVMLRSSTPMGAVALNILPWAKVARIQRDNAGVIPQDRSYVTPCRISLSPGAYTITCTNPRYGRPLVLRLVIQQDSLLEVTQQWPGYDVAKILTRF